MAVTIDQIYDKVFKLAGAGYDKDDVDRFLDEICDEMENMQKRIAQLEEDLKKTELEEKAAKAAAEKAAPVVVKNEGSALNTHMLEGILLSAQRLADEAVDNAKSKAAAIVKEAEEQAAKIVEDARGEKEKLTSQLGGLREGVAEYKKSFKALLEKYENLIEKEDFLAE